METAKHHHWSKIVFVKLTYEPDVKPSERPELSSSSAIYDLMKHSWTENTIELMEEFKIVLLNSANKLLGIFNASTGGVDFVTVDIRLILALAITSLATAIVLVHNHPAGHLKPTIEDIEITNKIKEACKYHLIRVLDHIIISSENYLSFADEGLL